MWTVAPGRRFIYNNNKLMCKYTDSSERKGMVNRKIDGQYKSYAEKNSSET